MVKLAQKIVVFDILLICFGDMIANILSFDEYSFQVFRLLPDLVVWIAFFVYLCGGSIKKPFLAPILLVLAFYILSIAINNSDVIECFSLILPMIRYIPVFFIISHSYFEDIYYRINIYFKYSAIVISIIVIIQILFPNTLSLFQPKFGSYTSGTLAGGVKAFGTFFNAISLGYFFLVVYLFFIILKSHSQLFLQLIIGLLIFFSGSLISFLCFIVLFGVYNKRRLKKTHFVFFLIIFFVLMLFFLPYLGIIERFTPEMFEMYKGDRLGLLFYVLPDFFHSNLPQLLFGYTHDTTSLEHFIFQVNNRDADVWILKVWGIHLLADTYWVGLFYYFGLLGVSCFLFFYTKIYNCIKKHGSKDSAYYTFLIMCCTVVLNFFNPNLVDRVWSFFLYLTLGCLVSLITKNRCYA